MGQRARRRGATRTVDVGRWSGRKRSAARTLQSVSDAAYGPVPPAMTDDAPALGDPFDGASHERHRSVPAAVDIPFEAADAPDAPQQATFDEIAADLIDELSDPSASGIGVLYRALGEVVERLGVEDAVLVVDEPGLGRQMFHAGRQPVDDGVTELLESGTGLYLEPEVPTFDQALVVNLCLIALRLDLLRYDAWHDPLTGLYDRRSFDRLLERAVARSRRYNWRFTLVILDLDAFKALNDLEGHAAGDDALRMLADRFKRVLRFGDDVARIGGDEFGLLLPNTDPANVPGLLERVHTADANGHAAPAFSYGLAVSPTEADDFDTLFRLADKRLYEAKKSRAE